MQFVCNCIDHSREEINQSPVSRLDVDTEICISEPRSQSSDNQGRKSVFNIGGYNLEFRSIFRSFETLEGVIENFRAEKTLFIFEKRSFIP